jgi:hypothetical protein
MYGLWNVKEGRDFVWNVKYWYDTAEQNTKQCCFFVCLLLLLPSFVLTTESTLLFPLSF